MDKPAKVAYGLALSSLALVFLAGSAALDRVTLARDLQATEAVILALATLTETCQAGAPIDKLEDEFADAMQNHPDWCTGVVPQVVARWDSSSTYEFGGFIRVGSSFRFSWVRDGKLKPPAEAIKKLLASADSSRSHGETAFKYEVIRYPRQGSLLREHSLWFASGYVESLNFRETLSREEWVTYLEITNRPDDERPPRHFTTENLHEMLAATSVRWGLPNREAETVYASLASKWQNQSIKVPLLGLELPFVGAIAALAIVSLLQLIWLAALLPSVAVDDCRELLNRLSLTERLKTSSVTLKIASTLDWVSLTVCRWLILSAPILVAISAGLVTFLTGETVLPTLVAVGAAIISTFPALRIAGAFRDLRERSVAMEGLCLSLPKTQGLPDSLPDYIKNLLDEINSGDLARRQKGLKTLEQSDPPLARTTLADLLHHGICDVRIESAFALARLDDERAIPGLIATLHEGREGESTTVEERSEETGAISYTILLQPGSIDNATTALVRFGSRAIPDLRRAMRDNDAKTQSIIVDILGKIGLGHGDVVSDLVSLFQDREPDVKLAAIRSIGQIGTAECVPELLKVLHDNDAAARARRAALMAIQEIGGRGPVNHDAADTLFAVLLREENKDLRVDIIYTLGYLGEVAVTYLLEVFGDPYAPPSAPTIDERIAAAYALGQVGNACATKVLREVLQSQNHPNMRAEVARDLGRMISPLGNILSNKKEDFQLRSACRDALKHIGTTEAIRAADVPIRLNDSLDED